MRIIAGVLATIALIGAALTTTGSVSAHLTAVSPYTYWRDVLPIFEARCGRCHGEGNPSGLMLLNYPSARGASWLLRQRLIRGHMPPWHAEGPFKSPEPVTSRELNILMTWASGAAPEGRRPESVNRPAPPAWPLGVPDLVATMPAPFTFAGEQGEQVHEVVLPRARIGGRIIRAVDLRPGTPAIVRSAEIIARKGKRDQLLGLWQPGELPAPFAIDAGFKVESRARLVLRIRYRRLFGASPTDTSEVGIYFANRTAAPITAIELTSSGSPETTHVIAQPSRLVAVRPLAGASGTIAVITLERADGTQRELGRIQIQRDWARRYVLREAVQLTKGDKIVMSMIASQSGSWSTLTGERVDSPSPIRVAAELAK